MPAWIRDVNGDLVNLDWVDKIVSTVLRDGTRQVVATVGEDFSVLKRWDKDDEHGEKLSRCFMDRLAKFLQAAQL